MTNYSDWGDIEKWGIDRYNGWRSATCLSEEEPEIIERDGKKFTIYHDLGMFCYCSPNYVSIF